MFPNCTQWEHCTVGTIGYPFHILYAWMTGGGPTATGFRPTPTPATCALQMTFLRYAVYALPPTRSDPTARSTLSLPFDCHSVVRGLLRHVVRHAHSVVVRELEVGFGVGAPRHFPPARRPASTGPDGAKRQVLRVVPQHRKRICYLNRTKACRPSSTSSNKNNSSNNNEQLTVNPCRRLVFGATRQQRCTAAILRTGCCAMNERTMAFRNIHECFKHDRRHKLGVQGLPTSRMPSWTHGTTKSSWMEWKLVVVCVVIMLQYCVIASLFFWRFFCVFCVRFSWDQVTDGWIETVNSSSKLPTPRDFLLGARGPGQSMAGNCTRRALVAPTMPTRARHRPPSRLPQHGRRRHRVVVVRRRHRRHLRRPPPRRQRAYRATTHTGTALSLIHI